MLWLIGALSGGCGAQTPGAEELEQTGNVAVITLERHWLLEDDGLTDGEDELGVTFTLPKRYKHALVVVGDGAPHAVSRGADGAFAATLPVAELGPGEHQVRVVSKASGNLLGAATFVVSYPLYVVVSTDWDDTRMGDAYLARMEELRHDHPALRVTQFFAPYHYTDPQVGPARKDEIDRWVKRQRDEHGDEIGVHIHGWCHFVTTSGVPCRTAESFYRDDGSGYTTILAAYEEDEMVAILERARAVYAEHGLGSPTSFRAGGWTADAKVMRALARTGFTVDTSAVPPHRLATWQGYTLFDWNSANWAAITETTQPYFPADPRVDTHDPSAPIPILEVPDNGVLVDYVSGADMVEIFEWNYHGKALEHPTLYQVGWHPPNFSSSFLARMDEALSRVDAHLHEGDRGPVVYVTISELTRVWPLPGR
jgi:hypothetical protein